MLLSNFGKWHLGQIREYSLKKASFLLAPGPYMLKAINTQQNLFKQLPVQKSHLSINEGQL